MKKSPVWIFDHLPHQVDPKYRLIKQALWEDAEAYKCSFVE